MDLEDELRKSMTEQKLEELIEEKIKSFHGLLTREVAVRLIAKENGLLKNEEKFYKLADIPKGEKRIGFNARIKKIWPIAEYSSGKKSRVIEVDDKTATKPLILWNDDIELSKEIRVNDEIKVTGVYERNGELHFGYSGKIKILNKAEFSELSELDEGEYAHLRGMISSIEGYDKFVADGRTTDGFSFFISDGKTERRCVIFGGMDRAKKIEPKDEIIIENAMIMNGNVRIDESTRILLRRLKNMTIGEIKEIKQDDGNLVVKIGEEEKILNRENALRFFNVEIADDIDLSTIIDLKKELLLNSKVAIKEVDGKITRV
ncbi:MAG: hypothetical protein ABH842_04605 [Candidatus Micrarchaeota archaeon]